MVIGLLILIQVFLNVTGVFLILFLIECQGVFIIYFLLAAREMAATHVMNGSHDTRKYLYRRYFLQLNVLLMQFWAAFVASLLLVVTILRLTVVGGGVTWVDLNYVSFFIIVKYSLVNYIN